MHPQGPDLEPLQDPCRRQGPRCGRWGGHLPRGWGPSEPPTWPADPPHTEEIVGHLLSTLATRLRLDTPRISNFSGNATPGKTEVSFEQWYHKVKCIKDHYPELVVQESTVRSLKGAAADMAQYKGPTGSVTHILQKLAVIFGTM